MNTIEAARRDDQAVISQRHRGQAFTCFGSRVWELHIMTKYTKMYYRHKETFVQ